MPIIGVLPQAKPCPMQLMAELSGEQGSSADLLRRLEQAESKAAALEAKVQVLAAHHA